MRQKKTAGEGERRLRAALADPGRNPRLIEAEARAAFALYASVVYTDLAAQEVALHVIVVARTYGSRA
jgi:hypothetical protein